MESTSLTTRFRLTLGLLSSLVLPVAAAQAQSPGAQDSTFTTGADANGAFYALALQADGQVLVGGSFTTFHGSNRNAIAQLEPNGSLDTFSPGLAFSGYNGSQPTVRALAVQSDGKVLAAGSFTVQGQSAGGGVVRLNSDGSLDSTFNAGTGAVYDGGQVGVAYTLNVLPNGQILVGGAFQRFNGVNTAGLVRLNSNGSVDTSFNPNGAGITANNYGLDVSGVAVMPDGRIVIGGHFSTYDGHSANGVARLNPNGTFDSTFDVGEGIDDGGAQAVAVQANGQVLVGGGYNNFDGVSTNHLIRLNTDGSLDTSYAPGNGSLFVSDIDSLIVQPNGSVLAGGTFLSQGGLVNSPHNGLARFLSDGTQDETFDSGSTSLQVTAMALQSDGKAVVASNPSQLVGSAVGNAYRYFDTPAFFAGEIALSNGVFYLQFPNGISFSYYSYLTDPNYIFHFDLGYEYVFNAFDSGDGVYFYDFASNGFFYTSPSFAFPYLYDFSENSTVYYYPDPNNQGRYDTDGVRYFYVFRTGEIISK